MSRIAVISDIHANPYALDAVIDDIEQLGVDEVIVGGDLVGRGPLGRAVIERIVERGWPSVRGNHEDYTLDFRRLDVPQSWLVDPEWAASRWMAAELDDWHAEYIDSLPFTLRSEIDPGLRVFHGSPTSHSEGIGDWTPEEQLCTHWDQIDEDVLVCAHTHRPLLREVRGGLVVNVGSVGLPFNGDWRAQYALFEPDGDRWNVDFRGVAWDRDAYLRAFAETGFLQEGGITAELLRREVLHARPFLVPFLKWAEMSGQRPDRAALSVFLDEYDPNVSLGTFIARLRGMHAD